MSNHPAPSTGWCVCRSCDPPRRIRAAGLLVHLSEHHRVNLNREDIVGASVACAHTPTPKEAR